MNEVRKNSNEIEKSLIGVVLKKSDPTKESNFPKLNNVFKENKIFKDVTTLRLPIFCLENKPFVYIKVMNQNEKYRLSLNPDFLKNYSLNFKILRDQPLNDFLKWLQLTIQKEKMENPLIRKLDNNYPENKTQTSIYLKLPSKEQNVLINKHTVLLENDGRPGKTIIDKYQIVFPEISDKRTILFIIDRNFKIHQNSSIAFISEEFETFQEFILEYSKMF